MGTNVRTLIGAAILLLLPCCLFGQVKTLTQIELENIQVRQKRLFEAHVNEENPTDQESIEFRIFGLRDEYKALLSKNPDNVPVLVTFGLFLAHIDQREDALKLLLKADALEPEHPQVKNQLGNFMTEQASYQLALPYYLGAIELAPKEPLYHYQLGNLLYYFQKEFVKDGIFSLKHIQDQMFDAFKNAAKLAPDNSAYQYRYAESFYDYPDADLNQALKEWERIEFNAESDRDKQLVRLHCANVQLMLGNKDIVPLILEKVIDLDLQGNKDKLLKQATASTTSED
jgi:tetratricopeptide (TPR) repeat protein